MFSFNINGNVHNTNVHNNTTVQKHLYLRRMLFLNICIILHICVYLDKNGVSEQFILNENIVSKHLHLL